MARNGFRIFDANTHVRPDADLLLPYMTASAREKLARYEKYQARNKDGEAAVYEAYHRAWRALRPFDEDYPECNRRAQDMPFDGVYPELGRTGSGHAWRDEEPKPRWEILARNTRVCYANRTVTEDEK